MALLKGGHPPRHHRWRDVQARSGSSETQLACSRDEGEHLGMVVRHVAHACSRSRHTNARTNASSVAKVATPGPPHPATRAVDRRCLSQSNTCGALRLLQCFVRNCRGSGAEVQM